MARAVVCILLMTAVVAADEETARYFLERATRALDANRLDEAEKMLKRSISEHKDYAPTLLGLAELARRRGRPKLAIPHLDACLAQRARKDLTAAERTAIKAAEGMLAVLAAARVEFQRMVDEYVAKLMALAKKTKNPEVAAECLRMGAARAAGSQGRQQQALFRAEIESRGSVQHQGPGAVDRR